MYNPAVFAETCLEPMWDLMDAEPFGLLISVHDGVPVGSHLPLLLDRRSGSRGALLGHMARANPQWRSLAGQSVLAVFTGPHAYVSPQWYQADRVVPTWNYVAVHAYGRFEVFTSELVVVDLLADTVERFESRRATPWELHGPSEFLQNLAREVIAFRIEMERLEGKWKLSQNQPSDRRRLVAEALARSDDPGARQIARQMTAAVQQIIPRPFIHP